jgi:competence CoiA-like predicted nuclease
MSNLLSTYNAKSESFDHKAIKRLFFKYISENNKSIIEKSLEKYINNRRADVYFRLKSGEQIVVEVQNSKISVKEIINRTEHYNNAGMYILWVLHGNGACVASPKFPEDRNKVKISSIEKYLHRLYGGRVYYVNINFYKDKITISPPFALHFSFHLNKKYQKKFRTNYEIFYIRNSNFAKIPGWNLLCVNFNGFKLARFYDKNIKRVLKDKISTYYKKNLMMFKSEKKLLKSILNNFKTKYGNHLILVAIFELDQEKRTGFIHKIIDKIIKKINF